MAIGQVPKRITVDALSEKVKAQEKFLAVAVDGITNAENMGAIARNCACFSVDAMVVLPTSCDPYLRRSVRNSMGNIFNLPVCYISSIKEEIEKLKTDGVTLYGAHPDFRSKDIRLVTFSKKSCIVFGAEGNGISQEALNVCDELVAVPMKEGIDSLNVASASAVVLYEMSVSRSRHSTS